MLFFLSRMHLFILSRRAVCLFCPRFLFFVPWRFFLTQHRKVTRKRGAQKGSDCRHHTCRPLFGTWRSAIGLTGKTRIGPNRTGLSRASSIRISVLMFWANFCVLTIGIAQTPLPSHRRTQNTPSQNHPSQDPPPRRPSSGPPSTGWTAQDFVFSLSR